ncbi:hypothetical protein DVH05_015073 [Phytophthora capsici]|nr:hypothetical protein DVH05_015073 [Phytophthora capsici]
MPKPTETRRRDTIADLRALLESEWQDDETNAAATAQATFWTQFRQAVYVNDHSEGLDHLDDVALSIISEESSLPSLTQPVILLPRPADMRDAAAPTHELFQPKKAPVKRSAPTRSNKSPPSKKLRASKAKTKTKKTNPPSYSLNLPDNLATEVREDLDDLLRHAAAEDKTPFRLAYPWNGERAWYDPVKHPKLHLHHYRFWMKYRETFLVHTLYAPTKNSGPRRKLKASAIQARLKFLSYCIEEFGYFDFLRRFEDTPHDRLMWLGGKAAKHAPAGKIYSNSTPPLEDLATLYRKDHTRYDRTLARALDPKKIDEDGYTSIPELLEQTQALDPSLKEHLLLSDRALARVLLDVTQASPPPNTNWVGPKSSGVWKTLLSDQSLGSLQLEILGQIHDGTYTVLDDEKDFKSSEMGADDSHFEDDGGHFTVKSPSLPLLPLQPDDSADDSSYHDSDQDSNHSDTEDRGHSSQQDDDADDNDKENPRDDKHKSDGASSSGSSRSPSPKTSKSPPPRKSKSLSPRRPRTAKITILDLTGPNSKETTSKPKPARLATSPPRSPQPK